MHQSHWIGNIPRWWSTGFQVHKVHACPLPNQTRYHRGRIQCSLRFDLSQSGRYRANNGTPTWFRRSGTRCRQFAHRAYAPNEHVAEIGPCHELNALVQPLALRDGSISTAERSQSRQRIEIVVEIRQFGFDTACRSCPDIKFSISANLGSDFHRTASGIVYTVFDPRRCESTVDAEKRWLDQSGYRSSEAGQAKLISKSRRAPTTTRFPIRGEKCGVHGFSLLIVPTETLTGVQLSKG